MVIFVIITENDIGNNNTNSLGSQLFARNVKWITDSIRI